MPIIMGVIISVSVLSTIFVGARIFTRARLTGNMFLDDYLVVIAAVRFQTARVIRRTWRIKLTFYNRQVNGFALASPVMQL